MVSIPATPPGRLIGMSNAAWLLSSLGLIIGWAVPAVDGLPARPPPLVVSGSWMGGCDNQLKCEAVNVAADQPGPVATGVSARLTLDGQGQQAVIVFQFLDTTGTPIGSAMDGYFVKLFDPAPGSDPTGFTLTPVRPDRLVLSPDQTRRFLQEARSLGASEAEILAPGMRFGRFSIQGLPEIHDRLAARQNMARQPMQRAPIVRPLPYRAPVPSRLELIGVPETRFIQLACGTAASAERLSVQQWPLAGGTSESRLFQATCMRERGRLVHVWGMKGEDRVIRPLELPGLPGMTDRVAPFMVDAQYDHQAARLSVVQDGRPESIKNQEAVAFGRTNPTPTCGSSWSWLWTGTRFELEEMKTMPVCAGLQPRDWIVLWRVRVVD